MSDPTHAPYLDHLKRNRPNKSEVAALIARTRRGDLRARDTLLRSCLYFVPYVLQKMRRHSIDPEALIQDGNIGLLRAIEKFQPELGFAFATYAVRWILAVAGREERRRRSLVRAGRASRDTAWPEPDAWIDAPLPGTEGLTIASTLRETRPNAEDRLARAETDSATRMFVDGLLSAMDRDITWNRLASDSPDTLEEIANRHGTHKEKVRQREKLVKYRLGRYLDPEKREGA